MGYKRTVKPKTDFFRILFTERDRQLLDLMTEKMRVNKSEFINECIARALEENGI